MLHVTGAFFFVSGSVAAGVLNVLAVRAERPSETALLLRLIKTTVIVIGAGSVSALIFGIWLWHELGYSAGAFWIWASIVLWLIANALGGIGGKHQARARKLAEQLAAAGDASSDELRALLRDRKGNAMSWLAGVATIALLVLMIWKPGS
jgi:uncharacterized membrane protein